MPEVKLSVRDLLNIPAAGLPAEVLRAGIPDEELKGIRTQVTSALQGMPWSDLEAAVCSKFSEALDVDPVKLIASAWEKYSLVSDAAKKSKSGETVFVPLAEHVVKSELHPYVEIDLGPQAIRKIELDVKLSLKLKGIVLKVESEEIRAIQAGTCEGSAEIDVSDVSVWKHEFKPIALAGTIKLGTGIPIH